MSQTETVEIQKEFLKSAGKLTKYKELILGEKSLFRLMKYEFIIGIASQTPGAIGLLLRSKLYPKLLGSVGRNVQFGIGVVLRHPKKIYIGDNVVIDDHCVLDAKGQNNRGIFIGDSVFIGRNTILNCKNGDIILEDRVNIGFNCMIFSASEVRVGASTLIAAYCYLVGGTHNFDDPSIPVLDQGRSSLGIQVGPGGWIGAHVTVFDGVKIGRNVITGAGSIVNKDLADFVIAAGAPVRIIKRRHVKEEKERKKPPITIAVMNFNGEKYLEDAFDSIFKLDYPKIREVFLVDNNSTDNSVVLVRKKYPEVKIIKTGGNRGACFARNLAIQEARSEFIFLMDYDVVLSTDVLTKLEDAFFKNPQAGIVSAQIRFYDQPDKIQYNGAHIHFAGGAIQNKLDSEKPIVVEAVPGTALLVDKDKAEAIGLFDEDFFYGWEDGDFSFRMTIAGFPVLVHPKAAVFHRKAKRGLHWVDYQVRNRWWFILKTYHFRTFLVLLPAIFLYQLAIFCFMTIKGHFISYCKGSVAVLASLPGLMKRRKAVMRKKIVCDRQVLQGGKIDLMGDVESGLALKMASQLFNLLFFIYWLFARWFIT